MWGQELYDNIFMYTFADHVNSNVSSPGCDVLANERRNQLHESQRVIGMPRLVGNTLPWRKEECVCCGVCVVWCVLRGVCSVGCVVGCVLWGVSCGVYVVCCGVCCGVVLLLLYVYVCVRAATMSLKATPKNKYTICYCFLLLLLNRIWKAGTASGRYGLGCRFGSSSGAEITATF